MLKRKEILKTKNNDNYLSVILSDNSGEIEGKLWQIGNNEFECLTEGEPVYITAKVDKFKEKLQLNIEKIETSKNIDNEIINMLVPSTSKNIEQLFTELILKKQTISNKYLNKLIDKILVKDKEFSEKFKQAPGASKLHHAYRGGLMEHTVSVVNLCLLFAKQYTSVNKDILVAGALLHDIGKVEEYDNKTFKRTDIGKLLGHISIGISLIDRKISSIKNFPAKLEYAIKHLIASHHGELEWGSPVQPATIEALLLHYADNIDSKVETFSKLDNEQNGWHYNKSLRRDILVENFDIEENIKPEHTVKVEQKSIKTLFD